MWKNAAPTALLGKDTVISFKYCCSISILAVALSVT